MIIQRVISQHIQQYLLELNSEEYYAGVIL